MESNSMESLINNNPSKGSSRGPSLSVSGSSTLVLSTGDSPSPSPSLMSPVIDDYEGDLYSGGHDSSRPRLFSGIGLPNRGQADRSSVQSLSTPMQSFLLDACSPYLRNNDDNNSSENDNYQADMNGPDLWASMASSTEPFYQRQRCIPGVGNNNNNNNSSSLTQNEWSPSNEHIRHPISKEIMGVLGANLQSSFPQAGDECRKTGKAMDSSSLGMPNDSPYRNEKYHPARNSPDSCFYESNGTYPSPDDCTPVGLLDSNFYSNASAPSRLVAPAARPYDPFFDVETSSFMSPTFVGTETLERFPVGSNESIDRTPQGTCQLLLDILSNEDDRSRRVLNDPNAGVFSAPSRMPGQEFKGRFWDRQPTSFFPDNVSPDLTPGWREPSTEESLSSKAANSSSKANSSFQHASSVSPQAFPPASFANGVFISEHSEPVRAIPNNLWKSKMSPTTTSTTNSRGQETLNDDNEFSDERMPEELRPILCGSYDNDVDGNNRSEANKAAFVGRVLPLAKIRSGSRFLQRLLASGDREVVALILREVEGIITELMVDQYGNYLCQQLFETCTVAERRQMLKILAPHASHIACDRRGTHSLQSLISLISTVEEELLLIERIKSDVLNLSMHPHGTHVVQRALVCFHPPATDYIFLPVIENLDTVAQNPHGLCVVKKCISATDTPPNGIPSRFKLPLLNQLTKFAIPLIQSPYGNYAVQHAFQTWPIGDCQELLDQVKRNLVILSTQKFSSNVVEKSIEVASEAEMREIITSISNPSILSVLINSSYGNFVVQKALERSSVQEVNAIFSVLQHQCKTIQTKRLRVKWEKLLSTVQDRMVAMDFNMRRNGG